MKEMLVFHEVRIGNTYDEKPTLVSSSLSKLQKAIREKKETKNTGPLYFRKRYGAIQDGYGEVYGWIYKVKVV